MVEGTDESIDQGLKVEFDIGRETKLIVDAMADARCRDLLGCE